MKKFYLTVGIAFLATSLFSQKSKNQEERKVVYADFAYATPSRDTLFLSKDDTISMNTYRTWEMDPTWKGVNPVILFVSQEFIDSRKSQVVITSGDTGSRN